MKHLCGIIYKAYRHNKFWTSASFKIYFCEAGKNKNRYIIKVY